MIDPTYIGLIAGALTTISFLPQVIKVWKTKSARDISFATFSIFFLGTLVWLAYGLEIGSLPVVVANGLIAILVFAVLALKIKFK